MKVDSSILTGDCETILSDLPEESVDLIFTSPVYADARKKTYGGIEPENYVEWFAPKAEQFFRVLKPTGTFVFVIKEKVIKGQRTLYVNDLISYLVRKSSWLWTEEWCWRKTTSFPGKWNNRFRDGFERILQFNKQRKFAMYQDAVRKPIGKWKDHRLKYIGDNDTLRYENQTGSRFAKNHSHWIGKQFVLPDNVVECAPETRNKKHSAVFPEYLPEYFIRLFSQSGDLVCDPFNGSGTTTKVAHHLGRRYYGIDIQPEYKDLAKERLSEDYSPKLHCDPRDDENDDEKIA